MRPLPIVTVAAVIAVAALVAWIAWRAAVAAPDLAPPAADRTPSAAIEPASAAPLEGSAPSVATAAGAERADATTAGPGIGAPPVPETAQWVDLTVLDARTREPVADAEVHWSGIDARNVASALPRSAAEQLELD